MRVKSESDYLVQFMPWGLRVAIHEQLMRRTLMALLAAGGLRFVAPWWAALLVGLVGIVAVWARTFARMENAWLTSFLGRGEDAGSARRLDGDVCYVVATDGSFGPVEPLIVPALVELQRALVWIEEKAKARGHAVAFRSLGDPLHLDEISPDDYPPKQWTMDNQRTGERLRKVIEERTRSIRSSVPRSQFFVVLLTNDPSRANFAMQSNREAEGEEIEVCVCHAGVTSETFAHEILHLFGAQDLYLETRGPPAYVAARKRLFDLARKQAPSGHLVGSIMAGRRALDEATLDVYTARAVGLTRDSAAGAPDPSTPVAPRPERSALLAALSAVRVRVWPSTLASAAIFVPWPAPRAYLLGSAIAVEALRTVVNLVARRRRWAPS